MNIQIPNKQLPEVESRTWPLNPATGQYMPAGPAPFKRFFVLKQLDGDKLLCVDENGERDYVALPFSMQQYFFEKTDDSGSRERYHDGYFYVWGSLKRETDPTDDENTPVSWQQYRTVSKIDPDAEQPEGEEAEVADVQCIAPAYVLNEPIMAMHFFNDKDSDICWMDINIAGRAFGKAPIAKIVRLRSESDDYLICTDENDDLIKVAKPYILQKTPWDGKEINRLKYKYQSAGQRTVTSERALGGGETSESLIETQLVTPSYGYVPDGDFEGEQLTVIAGETGIQGVEYMDINTAGRCWAVVDEEYTQPEEAK